MRFRQSPKLWLFAASLLGVGAALSWGLHSDRLTWWQARDAPFLRLPSRLEGAAGEYTAVQAFPGLTFDDPVGLLPLPRTNRLLVAERAGRIFAFENDPEVADKSVVLDLSDVTLGALDSGLVSLVFHPEFGDSQSKNRGVAFVQYAYSETPNVRADPEDQTPSTWRLSRFEVDPATGIFDRGSERVLIAQRDDSLYHQGGAMFFHPNDGFLYVSVGDEGIAKENAQRIDKDLFSGVLRLDVDQRGGSVSHPILKQPESGATSGYYIPSDNPFVGRAGVLEEFFAVGLRNPHRMTYDATDDLVWIGDVGQSKREEIDILKRGGNYQWNSLEGTRKIRAKPTGAVGAWTAPVLDLEREDAGGIIGGYVYRGSRTGGLIGKYVYADFVTGNVWALSYEKKNGEHEVRVTENEHLVQTAFRGQTSGITSFGVDATGELYFSTLGQAAHLWQLSPQKVESNAPKLLSQTGVFSNTPRLTPVAHALPYAVASPFWSDGAEKRRWIVIPKGERVTVSESGPWQFPTGTVFVKHFAMALDERRPSELSPLETRLLVAAEGGNYYGITYKWNAEASDAELVLQRQEETLEIRGADGAPRTQRYVYPAPGDCLGCHNPKAGYVLGVRTEQLNVEAREAEGRPASNLLLAWSQRGVFARPLASAEVATYPRLSALDDESRSVEDRLRSYWATNCAMCHGVDTAIRARWDARYTTPLDHQGIVLGPLQNGASLDRSAVVVPGDLERSMMFVRGSSTDPGFAMPPIGRRTADRKYLALLERWIKSLGTDDAAGNRN